MIQHGDDVDGESDAIMKAAEEDPFDELFMNEMIWNDMNIVEFGIIIL